MDSYHLAFLTTGEGLPEGSADRTQVLNQELTTPHSGRDFA